MNFRNETFGGNVVRNIGRALLMTLVASIGMGSAFAQDSNNLKFRGAIGVIPVTGVSATGTVNLNVVRGVNPGNPWRIATFDALITPDGHVRAVGAADVDAGDLRVNPVGRNGCRQKIVRQPEIVSACGDQRLISRYRECTVRVNDGAEQRGRGERTRRTGVIDFCRRQVGGRVVRAGAVATHGAEGKLAYVGGTASAGDRDGDEQDLIV